MKLNPWRKYLKSKPKSEGWYMCTLELSEDIYVTEQLWFDPIDDGKWIDKRRQMVFDGYKVYKSGRATLDEHRVYEDTKCDRTLEVVAWKRMPKAWGGK